MTKYTFRDFFNGKKKLKNIEPNITDWINHISTLFPQVRLKNFLEIRSMDACNWDLICSQPAFWIGLLYDDESLDKCIEIFENWTDDDREYLNKTVPILGLQTKFKNKTVLDFAQDIFQISSTGLQKRNILSLNNKFDETIHTKKLEKNLEIGYSPADCSIQKYKNEWNNSIDPIYKELIIIDTK